MQVLSDPEYVGERVTPKDPRVLYVEGFSAVSTPSKVERLFPKFCPFGKKFKRTPGQSRLTTDGIRREYQYHCCHLGCVLVCHWEMRSRDPRYHVVQFFMKECTHIGLNQMMTVAAARIEMPLPRYFTPTDVIGPGPTERATANVEEALVVQAGPVQGFASQGAGSQSFFEQEAELVTVVGQHPAQQAEAAEEAVEEQDEESVEEAVEEQDRAEVSALAGEAHSGLEFDGAIMGLSGTEEGLSEAVSGSMDAGVQVDMVQEYVGCAKESTKESTIWMNAILDSDETEEYLLKVADGVEYKDVRDHVVLAFQKYGKKLLEEAVQRGREEVVRIQGGRFEYFLGECCRLKNKYLGLCTHSY